MMVGEGELPTLKDNGRKEIRNNYIPRERIRTVHRRLMAIDRAMLRGKFDFFLSAVIAVSILKN